MELQEFRTKLEATAQPVVVDIWAPWCGPCRTLSPRLEQVGGEFAGQVEVWKINADEEPALVRELRVMGIPTLLFYRHGTEIARRTGVQSVGALREQFTAALADDPALPVPAGLSDTTRLLRLASGIALLVLAAFTGWPWLLLGAAGVILFSAVYDRCPIWNALMDRLHRAPTPAESDARSRS